MNSNLLPWFFFNTQFYFGFSSRLYFKPVKKIDIYHDFFCDFYPQPVGEGGFQSRQDSVWRPASRFLVGAKTQKLLVKSFWNFNMTFLATWGCASDFLEMLPKFKMAARGQLQISLWAQKY